MAADAAHGVRISRAASSRWRIRGAQSLPKDWGQIQGGAGPHLNWLQSDDYIHNSRDYMRKSCANAGKSHHDIRNSRDNIRAFHDSIRESRNALGNSHDNIRKSRDDSGE